MKQFSCPDCQKPMESNKDRTGFFCKGCKENRKIKLCPNCQSRMKHIKLPYGLGWQCKCRDWMWNIQKSTENGKPIGKIVITGLFSLKKKYHWQWFSNTKNHQTFEQEGFQTEDLSRKLKDASRVLVFIRSMKRLEDDSIISILDNLTPHVRKYRRVKFVEERGEDGLKVMAGW